MRPPIISYGLLFAIIVASPAYSASSDKGEAAGKTAFKIDPLVALQSPLLATPATELSATEYDLLEHARHNKMGGWTMARAALVISGVSDESDQQPYLAELAEIAVGCQQATANAQTQLAKAKALGKYLRANPLKAGYDAGSFNFSVLLDTGHFNCVSSAILYTIMAERCGLEVRTVTVADHVFLRSLDFDIEPTTGRVYSISDRNDRELAREVKNGNKPSAAYLEFKYRETGELGLLGTLYHDLADEPRLAHRYEEAVTTYLRAACLDPKDPLTVSNLRIMLRNWAKATKTTHQEAKAAKIDAFAKSLLRDPSIPNKTAAL